MRDKNIQRVAEWAKCSWEGAREMLELRPALFNRLLNWANVETDAEPLQHAIAEEEAKNKTNLNRNAQDSMGNRVTRHDA